MRAHKYLYEALMRLAHAEFTKGLESSDSNHHALANNLKAQVMNMWREFLNNLRQNNSELSAFWMSYVDMVEGIVLGLLRTSLEGDWDLHLHSIRMMISWCFAYDKMNYSRYLTPYFAQMTNLGDKNPEVQKAFKEGTFFRLVSQQQSLWADSI